MHKAIRAFLTTSDYHPCLLLVHPEVSRLERATEELASEYGWPQLRVGRELSAALLSQPPAGRSRLARQWMETRLRALAPGPVLCTEIDLLFEPTLHLDPLRLLRQASRITRLAVAWPGSTSDDVLTYAVPEHSHYRTWRKPEVLIAALD
ncbi:MAG: BREX-3 system P-loop-containing protein BrxF [Chloroflexi bacterium]|nr:BREX-3 system P-loop-containing protein BrxF [Chloroflexota bacterium]